MKASHLLLLTFSFILCSSFSISDRAILKNQKQGTSATSLDLERRSVNYTSDVYHFSSGDVWFQTTMHYVYNTSTNSFEGFYFENPRGYTQSESQSEPEEHLANVAVSGDSYGVTDVRLIATDNDLVEAMFRDSTARRLMVDDLNGLIR